MKCADLTYDLLLDFADWQLPPQERNRVARHLDHCLLCRARRDEVEAMSGALRRAGDSPPPAILDQLDQAVLGSVRRAESRGAPSTWRAARTRPLRPVALAAAAIVFFAVLGWLIAPTLTRGPRPVAVTSAPAGTAAPPAPSTDGTSTARASEPPVPAQTQAEPAPAPANTPPPAQTPQPAEVAVKPDPKAEPKPEASVAKPQPASEPKTAPPAPAPRVIPGDLNGDGVVDIADARILMQMLASGETPPAHADVNGDGVIDIADVRWILRTEVAVR